VLRDARELDEFGQDAAPGDAERVQGAAPPPSAHLRAWDSGPRSLQEPWIDTTGPAQDSFGIE
jgi:hypothetical protein